MKALMFSKRPEVMSLLRIARPYWRTSMTDTPVRIAPRTPHYSVVCNGFRHLLLFELKLRCPNASMDPLPFETAPERIRRRYESEPLARRAEKILERVAATLATCASNSEAYTSGRVLLAQDALRLANLDAFCRYDRLDPEFDVVDPADADDLLALLAVVPFESILRQDVPVLNPAIEPAGNLVGAVDADLIVGGRLVNVVTTKTTTIAHGDFDRLVAGFLFARQKRRSDPSFASINTLQLYLSRQTRMWSFDTAAWVEEPQFHKLEGWFVDYVTSGSDSGPLRDCVKGIFVPQELGMMGHFMDLEDVIAAEDTTDDGPDEWPDEWPGD